MPNERSFSWKFVLTFVGVVCVLGFVFAQLSGKLLFRQLAIHALAFSPDGKYLAASGVRYSKEAMGPGVLLVYEIGSKKLVLKEENLPSSLFQTAFSPDGQRLAVSYPRGRYVWDFRTKHWAEEKRMELPQSWPLGLIKDWLSVDDAKSWES
ncbi:hypothetical protein EON80_00795 [bacterium]|nr:MAG: hypothetical protein EON80_00795 [bacterium]